MRVRYLAGALLLPIALTFAGCEQWLQRQPKDLMERAQKKVNTGDFRGAIRSYEAALDGTAATAEAHYKMAILYDEKLKSPLDAMHHFQRYLELAPTGSFAKEAKAYRKEGELKLIASLRQGTLMSQDEAVRLKNENLNLRKQLVEMRAQKAAVPVATPVSKGHSAQKPVPPGSRTHTVQSGETLASIAQKYYKNKGRWKDIQDANFYQLEGTVKIQPGQKLIIP